jgi:hypothetical protein
LATGDYIWIAESDDYADPDLLATLVGHLDHYPRAGLAYCQSVWVDETENILATPLTYYDNMNPQRWNKNYYNHGPEECALYLSRLNTIPNASAVLIRRTAFEQVGGACESLNLAGDWLLWVKILLKWDIVFVAQPLNFFRNHAATVRHSSDNDDTFVKEFYFVHSFIAQRLDVPQEKLAEARNFVAFYWFKLGMASKLTINQHMALYKIARKVDPKVGDRLLTFFVKFPFRALFRKAETFNLLSYMKWLVVLMRIPLSKVIQTR